MEIARPILSGLVLLAMLFAGTRLFAETDAGVDFPHSVKVAGHDLTDHNLTLNGTGLRTASVVFISVKVYLAALYLEQPEHDAERILTSPGIKKLVLRFVREVSAEKFTGGLLDGLRKNNRSSERFGEEIEKLTALFKKLKQVSENDEVSFLFRTEEVAISLNGIEKERISGGAFSTALLRIWLGDNPPNAELKSGLLGQLSIAQ